MATDVHQRTHQGTKPPAVLKVSSSGAVAQATAQPKSTATRAIAAAQPRLQPGFVLTEVQGQTGTGLRVCSTLPNWTKPHLTILWHITPHHTTPYPQET